MTHSDPTRTFAPKSPDPPTDPFEPDLDAALAAAFGPESAPAGWSRPPLLRDDSSDGPVVQPASPEMPRTASDRYQLLGEVARGGMGVILKGRDPRLGRDLAFKVLKSDHVGKPAAEQRFVEEAQVGGQLQHPGILPVYDLGRFDDGRPFFAMKFVKGDTLAEKLAERAGPAADRGEFLQIFLKVSETLAYAHSRGVIHRDIKPSNIMVANYGEVLVMDWGLAKVLPRGGVADEARATQASRAREQPEKYEPTVIHTARVGSIGSETLAGSVMGTPAFMPPEQAGGEIDKLDERADVFGLGAVLCVTLTGKPPYVAADAEAVRLMAVRGKLEEAFRRLDASGGDAELVGLCKRCLSPEPADRPRHAGEVKEAIATYLAGVEARAHRAEVERAAAAAEAREQRKRRRVQAYLAAAVALLAVAGGAFGWLQERQAADRAVARARAEEGVTAALDQAEAGLAADKMPEADAALAQAATRLDEVTRPDLRGRYDELKRDREAARELDDVAERRWTVFSGPRLAGSDPKIGRWFGEAFRRYGLAIGEGEPAELAERVKASRVSAALVAGLNEWFFLVPQQSGLRAVLDRADPDPVRVEVRAAVAAGKGDRVRELAAKLDAAKLTPGFAVALGMDPALSDEEGYKLMKTTWDDHPDSFGLALRIGSRLSKMAQGSPPDRERKREVVAWNRTAIALRPRSALAYNNLGAALDLLGERDGKQAAFRRAIELAPDFAIARRNLIHVYRQKGELDAALADARRLVERFPHSAVEYEMLGEILKARKEYPAAADAYREAIVRDGANPIYHADLGGVLKEVRDYPAAAASYRRAIEIDPMNASFHHELGFALQEMGDHPAAAAEYRAAADARKPDDPWRHANLGWALRLTGDNAGAAEAYRKAIELGPTVAVFRQDYGIILRHLKDFGGATAAYGKAIQLDGKDARVYVDFGNVLRDMRDFAGAANRYRRAIEIDPKNTAAHNGLGNALHDLKDYPAAAASYRRAIEIEPKLGFVHNNLGNTLREMRDYPAAAASYRRAIEINPTDELAHDNLGISLREMRDYQAAESSHRRAIEINPKFANAYSNLARTLEAGHGPDAAVTALRELAAADPKNPAPLTALGTYLRDVRKDDRRAAAALRQAIERDPNNSGLWCDLGIALDWAKDFDEAAAALRKATEVDPTSPRPHYLLGNVLRERGDYPGEEASLRQAIARDRHRVEAYVLLARAVDAHRGREAMIAALRDLAAADPKNPAPLVALGGYLGEVGKDRRGAAAAFREATERDADDPGTWHLLGVALSRLKDFDGAAAAFRKATELDPMSATDQANLLSMLIAKKDWAGAITAGRRAVELAPTNPAGYVNLSVALNGTGQLPEARAVLTDAMAKLPAAAADPRTLLRYDAACAAALLGDRQAAYDGLIADLTGWAKLLADNPGKNAPELREQVGHWLDDDDLASVRDPKPLAALPAVERAKWEKLWTDVRALLARATPETGPPPREVKR